MADPRFDLVLHGGRLVLGDRIAPGSIGVRNGEIAAIVGDDVRLDGEAALDANGQLVLPGIVDIHVHFRDPGLTQKEDFASGTRAAARGGVTTVGDMPNTKPPITTVERFVAKRDDVAAKAHVDYVLWAGAVSSEHLAGFLREGAVGVKVFMTRGERPAGATWTGAESPHNPELFVGDDGTLLEIFREAARLDLIVAVHIGNQALRDRSRGHWHGKPFSDIAHELRAGSRLEKIEAAARCILFARETGARLHIVHVPGQVVPLVEQAKREGLRVTAESFCPFMPFELMEKLGPLGYDRYKSRDEIATLWQALRSGIVDNVATDHAPHLLAEKRRGDEDILACPSGYPEIETALPMMLDEVARGTLTLGQLVRLMASAPARLIGIDDRKGAIAVGLDADFVVVDPDREWTIGNETLETRCGWTPFAGRTVRGWPSATILRGQVIARDGEVVGSAGFGQLLRPRTPAVVEERR